LDAEPHFFGLKESPMGVPNSGDLFKGRRTPENFQPDNIDPAVTLPSSPKSASKLEGREAGSALTASPVAGKEASPSDLAVDSSPGVGGTESSAASAPSPEAILLAKAQEGSHTAFAQIYSLHKRRVYSLCLRMLGNVAEAEDLTQEAFLQLHRKIATFRGDSAFSTWLHRLTINVVLMHLRRKGLNLISLDEALDPGSEHGAVHGSARSFGAPDLRLTGSIDRMTLEKAVEDLPAGYRLIFVLHDIEGYEHNEIATLLDCSIGNSKSQLHKARMKLREALRSPADEVVTK
jgi:RNA polymerase sigma-70 factor, ECF subfamily